MKLTSRPIWGRFTQVTAGVVAIAGITGVLTLTAQTPGAPQATTKPFLWRVEGPVPSYLYGTIHVPDPKVLEIPVVVRRAFEASDALYTEIPLDPATQISVTPRLLLPAGQDLKTVVGEAVFNRMIRVISNSPFGKSLPPGSGDLLAASMSRMKPIMALMQLLQLDYMPDVLAGRKSLDATLYDMATTARKQAGGLETVDEQMAVLDSLTLEEQVQALTSGLDSIEKPVPGQITVQKLVSLYLDGDLEAVAEEINKKDPELEFIEKKFKTSLLDDRNVKMADRIATRLAEQPAKTYFFAVGAAHYPGDKGLVALLAKKGLKITRLTPADAATIRPAGSQR